MRADLTIAARELQRAHAGLEEGAERALPQSDTDRTVAARLREIEVAALQRDFARQGAFLYLPEFLPPAVTKQLVAAVGAVAGAVNRNYLPGHKQGGSVSRRALDRRRPRRARGE